MARKRIIRKLCTYSVISVLFILIVYYSLDSNQPLKVHDDKHTKVTFENIYFKEKLVKRILVWTPMFKHGNLEGEKACLNTCSARCDITDDKSQIEHVDAVDFHLSDIWTKEWRIGTKSVIKFPKYRKPVQVWIVGNMEPPPHLYGNIRILNGIFNWTKWYRHDADILWPYGEVYQYNVTEQAQVAIQLKDKNFFKEKSKEIVLRISNCFDPGQRYRFIKALDNYVHIDKFGKCYNEECGDPSNPHDRLCSDIIKTYKFYLALENDQCRDYVTEKYWSTLDRDQIPIVNWKSVDRTKVIPNSYINIFDFNSVEDLARYLKHLSVNETLYNSYFEHKKKYTNRPKSCVACTICKALHDKTRPAQVYTDLEAWVQNDICEKVGLWNNFLKNFYGWRFTLFGF